jgi:hypothetical protein
VRRGGEESPVQPVVAALGDVMGDVGSDKPGSAGHIESVEGRRMESHEKYRLSPFLVLIVFALASVVKHPQASDQAGAPLLAGARISPEVFATIQRACRDCHSEATQYPWYSYIAPVSFLIEYDVASGREHLNLSKWNEYPIVRRERLLSEIANQVRDGGMPLPIYTFMHRDSRLSKGEIDAVFQWTQVERARLIEE